VIPAQSRKIGAGVYGMPFMKFTLTYDGPLPASANKPKNQDKWDIRQKLDPQLRDLWANHPAMQGLAEVRRFPKKGGGFLIQTHHLHPGPVIPPVTVMRLKNQSQPDEVLDLCEPIEKHGAWFLPIVRESFALHCGIKILFLRHEPPGKIYQGGDIDGRIKTLLDALSIPQHAEQILDKSTEADPIHCLVEDESLISGLNVETERLLNPGNNPNNYVRLIIEVDVRVKRAMIYNQSFL
jgi:hypothetical protein